MKKYMLNGLEVTDIEVDGINYRDVHDWCDAFICSAFVKENGEWRKATDDELDQLNEDSDLVYEVVESYIY